jgi:hypothetical protein
VRKLPARFRQVAAKATRGGGPPFTKFGRRSFIAGITIYREHQERPMKAQTEAEPKQSKGKHRPDSDSRADRAIVAARFARAIGRGRDVIYNGTRAPEKVLRSGKLIPNGGGVSFSRSPEIAAHFAYLVASELDGYLPALLVLDRRSLRQVYRLEPNAEDWDNHEEEEIVRRAINFRRHLLGVVRESDVSRVLGPQQTNLFHQIGRPRNGWPINAKRGNLEDGFFAKDRREYETLLSRSESEPAWRMHDPRYLRALNPHQTAGLRSNEIARHRSAAKSMTQANFWNDTNPIHIGRANTATPAALGRKPARSPDPKLGTSQ